MGQNVEAYKLGYSKFLKELEGLSEEELLFRPSEEHWSIKEIIIHVVDAELVHIHRMKAILAEENPVFAAFDQDLWTTRLQTQQLDQEMYLELFKMMRESFAPILENLTDADYARVGTHREAGVMTFREVIEHAVDHVDHHMGQIQCVKRAMTMSK